MTIQLEDALLRLKDVRRITSLGKSTIYRLEKAGRFPQKIAITQGSVGWRLSDINAWIAARSAKVA